MKLSYRDQFPWLSPTNFKEKILKGTKIHTFRTDEKNRWPPISKTIHHTYFNRTPKEDIFLISPCTGVQKAQIIWKTKTVQILIDNHVWAFCPREGHDTSIPYVYMQRLTELALNDGFDSPSDFFKWFSEDWTGKIIHWTDKRYRV